MVLRTTSRARLGWLLLILPALLLGAACGGGDSGDDGGGGDDALEGTPLAPAQTFLALRTIAAQTIVAGTTQTPQATPDQTAGEADPEAAVDAVIEQVLLTQVEEEDIEVVSATAGEWPDSCLGVVYAVEEAVCEDVITPGFEVVVHFGDTTMTWRASEDGAIVRFVTQEISEN